MAKLQHYWCYVNTFARFFSKKLFLFARSHPLNNPNTIFIFI